MLPRLAVLLGLPLGRIPEQVPPLGVAHGRAGTVPQRDGDEAAWLVVVVVVVGPGRGGGRREDGLGGEDVRGRDDALEAVGEAAHADVVRRATRLGLERVVEGREGVEVAGGLSREGKSEGVHG